MPPWQFRNAGRFGQRGEALGVLQDRRAVQRGDAGICCSRHVVPTKRRGTIGALAPRTALSRDRVRPYRSPDTMQSGDPGNPAAPCSREYVARTPLGAPYLPVQETNRRDGESVCARWPETVKAENCGAEFGNCRTEPDSFGRFFRRRRRRLLRLECAAQPVQRSPHSMTEGLRRRPSRVPSSSPDKPSIS